MLRTVWEDVKGKLLALTGVFSPSENVFTVDLGVCNALDCDSELGKAVLHDQQLTLEFTVAVEDYEIGVATPIGAHIDYRYSSDHPEGLASLTDSTGQDYLLRLVADRLNHLLTPGVGRQLEDLPVKVEREDKGYEDYFRHTFYLTLE